jgi:hypothetical protein
MAVRATFGSCLLIRGTLHTHFCVKDYLDYYRNMFLDFSGPEYVEEPPAVSRQRQRSTSLSVTRSPITFSALRSHESLTGRPLDTILNSGNIAKSVTRESGPLREPAACVEKSSIDHLSLQNPDPSYLTHSYLYSI